MERPISGRIEDHDGFYWDYLTVSPGGDFSSSTPQPTKMWGSPMQSRGLHLSVGGALCGGSNQPSFWGAGAGAAGAGAAGAGAAGAGAAGAGAAGLGPLGPPDWTGVEDSPKNS